ncbi:MAG TPA: hypothetical protein VHZ09_03665 [Acidobacteriaceae bacterium]|nr:hypothetical protein [Acidobacteriaceae bacterium]
MAIPHNTIPSSRAQSPRAQTIVFTRRQVALTLRILMLGESSERLADFTNTAAADLQLIAAGKLSLTTGLLSYLNLQRRGRNFVWQF